MCPPYPLFTKLRQVGNTRSLAGVGAVAGGHRGSKAGVRRPAARTCAHAWEASSGFAPSAERLLKETMQNGQLARPGQAGGKPKIDGSGVRPSIAPTLAELGVNQGSVLPVAAARRHTGEEFEEALADPCTMLPTGVPVRSPGYPRRERLHLRIRKLLNRRWFDCAQFCAHPKRRYLIAD